MSKSSMLAGDDGTEPGWMRLMSTWGTMERWTWMGNLSVWANDGYIAPSMTGGETHDGALIREHLADILRTASVMIDVGAHIGSHAIAYALLSSPNARVFAFEAQRQQFALLRRNLDRSPVGYKVHARHAAAGHRTAPTVTLSAFAEDGPGVRQPVQYGSAQPFNLGGLALGMGGESISMVALDDLFPEVIERLDFLKLDVEGAEPFVLLGAARLVQRFRPTILLERNAKVVNPAMCESVGWSGGEVPEAVDLLREWGYRKFQALDPENLLCA